MVRLLVILMALWAFPVPALAQPETQPAYAVGQVWEYQTRPQDAGSRLKIQQIETAPDGTPIYHISVTGVHFSRADIDGNLPHLPVSKATLDTSVTKLAIDQTGFPDLPVQDGIAQWRQARGGVFTITMKDVIQFVDQMLADADPAVKP